jgi:hypothetical protein
MNALFDDGPALPEQAALPPIQGTQNQIPWAEQVRKGKLASCRKALRELRAYAQRFKDRGQAEQAERHWSRLRGWIDRMELLEREASARFWLDHRSNEAAELLSNEPANPGGSW